VAVADAALALAGAGETPATRDPGHGLIGPGRRALERTIGYTPGLGPRLRRIVGHLGLRGYLAALGLACLAVLGLALAQSGAQGWIVLALFVVGLGPAFEAGSALVNLVATRTVPPRRLPGMDLADGIPPDLRCLVAVPVLLDSVEDLAACIERLEVHHLSSTDGALHYAVLADGPDATAETRPQDTDLVAHATREIARLNRAYPSQGGDRFLFLHRRRQWNSSMGVWMGWERKRGKLTELNRLLRGATDTSFRRDQQPLPPDIRFVITLDADTRLLRGTVRRTDGRQARPSPEPRPVRCRQPARHGGYGILQPRVSPSLPCRSGPVGLPKPLLQPRRDRTYAAAASDLYQDLFGEGSFTGKGIYDVDAFEAALDGRVPENTLLSHDLFEGDLCTCGPRLGYRGGRGLPRPL
jgi:cyclic beta-1,2-glucan synthetase